MAAGSLMNAKIVRIRVEEGKAGLFYATSPDLKGLLVASATLDGLEKEIPETIKALFAADEIEVVVVKVQGDDASAPWVAIPVHHMPEQDFHHDIATIEAA
jgi:hypothetical protein